MADTKAASGGLGFFSILTLIFITLKLTGNIAWSWWWVLAPTWIPVGTILLILLGICIVAGIIGLAGYLDNVTLQIDPLK